jgi:hypothetical protein
VKTGDAKPRIYCHALHGYDSLAAENKCFRSHNVGCIKPLTAQTRANDRVPLSKIWWMAPESQLARVFLLITGFDLDLFSDSRSDIRQA